MKHRDWCTLFPDGTWGGCCKRHDEDYAAHRISRAEADRALRDCVRRRGHPVTAWVMWAGVRLFGWWFWRRARPMRGLMRRWKARSVRTER